MGTTDAATRFEQGLNGLLQLPTDAWLLLVAGTIVVFLAWFVIEGSASLLRRRGGQRNLAVIKVEGDEVQLLKTEWAESPLAGASRGDAVTVRLGRKKYLGKLRWRYASKNAPVKDQEIGLPQDALERLGIETAFDSPVRSDLHIHPPSSLLDRTWRHPDEGIRLGTRVGLITSAAFFVLDLVKSFFLGL